MLAYISPAFGLYSSVGHYSVTPFSPYFTISMFMNCFDVKVRGNTYT